MDSHYKKMLDLLSEMEIGFTVQIFENSKRIGFRPGHSKVDVDGCSQASFDFDKDGNFTNLLLEE